MSQHTGQESPASPPPAWERETLEKVLLASIEEQRRARRWGIFFKSLLALFMAVALWVSARPFAGHSPKDGGSKHTAVIDVAGLIAPGQPASADNLIEGLRDAAEQYGQT